MWTITFVLFLAGLCTAQFPDDFKFGVSTAAYQIEGAWNEDGKGISVWDHLTHTQPDFVADGSNADIACDAYHKTQEDVQLLVDLGVDFYRFSIAWTRILPSGHVNYVNQAGIDYYNELIDALIANGITPFVTIYHSDLPQALQEIGGWPNPILADYYVDYANILFANFGDRVKDWITINEPAITCRYGYAWGLSAPGYTQEGIGEYLCSYTMLLAHAKAYELYNNNYRDTQNGRVGIVFNSPWGYPSSDSEEDVEAAQNYMQFELGWVAHPIFSETGDFPPIMRERVDRLSAEEGFQRSRLPTFTKEEIELLKDSADFLGLNHYTTEECSFLSETDVTRPSTQADYGAVCVQPADTETGASSWLHVVPSGMRNVLNWIKDEYGNPEVIITENGFSDFGDTLNDCRRINYYNGYLQAVLDAIDDGCQVTSYSAWSFMDNFEWGSGYLEKFGLYHVDFNNDNRTRTPKMSSFVFKNIIQTRAISTSFTPEGFEACDFDETKKITN